MTGPALPRTLGLRDLVLLELVAIINVSLLPPVAGYGRVAIALWCVAFALFFVPEAVAVLTFARRYPGEGGIYLWTRREWGERHGFVSGWCYWTGNLFYFPMQLVYLAGVLAFAGGASTAGLVEEKWFVAAVAFVWLVVATGANLVGLAVGKWIPNLGAIGTATAIVAIVFAGATAGVSGHAAPVPFVSGSPADLLSALGVMSFAFMGLELASTMGDEMRNSRRDLPRAALVAGLGTLLAYVGVTASLQALIPASEIGAIQGVVQGVAAGATRVGAAWLVMPLALALAVSIGGGLSAWYAGSTRIPFVAGFDHALPAWLGAVHPRYGSPHLALVTQGAISALLIVATLAGSTVAEAYQVLLRSSVVTTLVPFLYMFAALVALKDVGPATRAAGAVGFVVSFVGAVTAFVPGPEVGHVATFEMKLAAGVVVPIAIGLALYARAVRARDRSSGIAKLTRSEISDRDCRDIP